MEQVPLRDGPSLTIDQLILYQLLGDPAFYAALPPGFGDVSESGPAAYRVALGLAMAKSGCAGCSTLKGAVYPLQCELGARLSAVHAASPEALEPLAALVARKRGYRPRPITMYFKDSSGVTRQLSF